jgi:hypothetical protein
MTAPEHLPTQDLLAIGIRLARTQFPGLRNAIDELLRRDENFRDMCEELADLEEAIASADIRPNVASDVLAEWVSLRDRQVQVMADALSRANVVSIRRGSS